MAYLTGRTQIFSGDTAVVDTTLEHPLGTRAFDAAGNEYIYLTGVASTAAGSWVYFDEALITTLTVANSKGRIGVAMAAIVASRYGWYQIYGKNTIALGSAAITSDNKLWVTATAGQVDDTDVAVDLIDGAIARGACSGAGSTFTVELNYPICLNEVKN